MCIAIFCPAGVRPTKSVLRQSFENNPDGAGYAYGNGKRAIIRKGFYTWRSFWEDFRAHAPKDAAVVIHFRIATSGKINGENCHPFRVDNKHVLIHNGNLAGKIGLACDNISDTALFVGNILRPTIRRSSEIWRTLCFKYLMEESIGAANKCVIMDANGRHVIFNEKQGVWDNGVWYSNRSFTKEKVHRPVASSGTEKFNAGVVVCNTTFALKWDIVNPEPSILFWTKRRQDDKLSKKRADFYSRMHASHTSQPAASGANGGSGNVASGSFGETSFKNWSQII